MQTSRAFPRTKPLRAQRCAAFTLIELLVVIGIIAILVGLLIPASRGVRLAADGASTRSEIAAIDTAIISYYSDFHAYPGPLADAETTGGTTPSIRTAELASSFNPSPQGSVTGTENMVLGLLGGLAMDTSNDGYTYWFDKTQVGQGAISLNTLNPKRYGSYLQVNQAWMSKGVYRDDAGRYCKDTAIPEFVDQFPNAMPIIYVRARPGASGICDRYTNTNVQYNIDQVFDYTLSYDGTSAADQAYPPTGQCIGLPSNQWHGLRVVGIAFTPGTTVYNSAGYNSNGAWDGLAYFTNPSTPTTAIHADSYVLIAAGKDRIYGSADDITNFGSTR